MSIKNFGLAWIVVADLKKAVEFYTKTIGLKLNEYNVDFGWAELAGHDGGAILGIAQTSEQELVKPGQNAVVTLSVENLQKSKTDLTAKNIKWVGDVIEVPGHVKMQYFRDPDGNLFQLVEVLHSDV